MNPDRTGHPLKILLVDDDPAEHLLLKRTLEKVDGPPIELDYVGDIDSAVECVKAGDIDIVFLDNRLVPNNDFRETAPQLREAGYVGPIGIISSDISGSYFQQFPDFGVDFRIGKDEIDRTAISFIISEYTRDQLSDNCAEDFS
ncbi:MAG: response regulator [Hoeflea sp.]|uniref:response regulator n=1 Tax=Hoeflea sp. TaxID=1940281 RepID=UPI001D32411B|nr:response regulator [Hoeflea sp.]MBU4530674.1 response regulator [Alphaproteobacteria bacterium]MBU4544894.1 response regulator [Alphaproteobacteria bacterium]MBU4552037.1 response regulator [Alphaproteobacteria bacterium]MBV1722226.1 response regulator [Hoeflea sp.]MBV1761788.1 response regulator [Hoeflea sp.]